MKKIILLLLSGLLIACMAGSALANVVITIPAADKDSEGRFVVLPGHDGYMSLELSDMTTQSYSETLTISDQNAVSAEIVDSDHSNLLNLGPVSKSAGLSISQELGLIKNSDTILAKIKVHRNEKTDLAQVTVVFAGHTYTTPVVASGKVVAAPEFPTVALPVAAVIGLIFIFGRKRGDL